MRKEKSSKFDIEATLVWVLGMALLFSVTIRPSSAQICWDKLSNCLADKRNQSTLNPELNPKSSTFNQSDYLCCTVMKQISVSEKLCFCTAVPTIQNLPPENQTLLIRAYSYCNVTDSLTALELYCGVTSTPSASPGSVNRPPPPPGGSINVLPSPASPTPPPPPPSPSPGKKKTVTIIAVSSSIGLVLTALGISICIYTLNARRKKPPADDIITSESVQYEFEALKKATNNFSEDHKIGKGGFGFVYKGTLSTGQEVAVKRLSKGSWQGDTQFMTEAGLVAKLQHRNLVRLVGFCVAQGERLLVYEFMPNKSLDQILFDPEKQKQLNWSKRYTIVKGIARGMLYLQEDSPTRIIHRDLKAANVLLDLELNPKIADFGMAKIFSLEQTHDDTSRVMGTHGYMAPEYLLHGQFSIKSDIYSFGVLVLEIVCGKRVNSSIFQIGSSNSENLLGYAWRYLKDRRPLDFMDPTLKDSYSINEITRCIHIGLLCVQEDPRNRPSMGKVMLMFNSETDVSSLSFPKYPGRMLQTNNPEQSTSNNSTSMPWSGGDASFTQPTVR